jgi:hypothetical protein
MRVSFATGRTPAEVSECLAKHGTKDSADDSSEVLAPRLEPGCPGDDAVDHEVKTG